MKKLSMKGIIQNWKKWHLTQVIVLAMLTILLCFFGVLHAYSRKADISKLNNELSQATVFYDMNGKIASKVSANKNEGVPIKQVPDSMKNAVVAIEDHRFYQHNGIDFVGMSRALFRDLKQGELAQGGSTITQQLAKNTLLNSQKTFKRKFDEVFLAMAIERKYSKQQILQMYLNQIYFGDGAWGLKQAASKYFAKDVKDLSISESAMLAGLIRAPSALNPYEHIDKALVRRNLVLSRMKEDGYITKKEYEKARTEKVALNDKGGDPFRGKYPYYVDQVIDEAIQQYGLSQDELLTGGYKIYTELDPNIQSGMEQVYKNDGLFPKGNDRLVQSGGVLVDPRTGGVRALVGGRGEHIFRGYNRASQLKAQPGSSFKPIVVYTPALEEGWKITDMLKDEPIKYGDYQPSNYNHRYAGEVTMYDAVKDSKNTSAVWLLNEMGIQKGLDAAKRFGITLDKADNNLAVALGGLHKGVSPMNMAEAYTVFPNHGYKTKTHVIRKIVDPHGNVIGEWKGQKDRVTTRAVTDDMNTMLLGVVEQGSGKGAQIPGREIAGKTGTTQVPIKGIDGVKDQWFVGYTPQLVGAIWVGYDKTDESHYLNTTSGEGAAYVFRAVMENALQNKPYMSFNVRHISDLMEQQQGAEAQKDLLDFQNKFNNEVNKWEEKWNKQRDQFKKVKEHGHGHGHGD
jgi:penicillin-binding protein 2A